MVMVTMMVMMVYLADAHPVLDPYSYPPMPYDLRYGVRDQNFGNDFGHEEQNDGNSVSGRYYVLLPDGRRQVVTYTADHQRGYVATITYENVGFASQGPANSYS
ncbi:Pro-resilin-like 154 [Homarus americanus]|uniref:Pro-resilin-like 154 n=2 Tax=Homarus americanus TaxID=6706 RepID=A0A8J5JAV8_HOMAM|nr:Pro-resilin-like 154 [Homarus americanus]